eukprot:scaffold15231_cov60-Phaeocystis_antarctica.AAC.3
MSVTVEVSKLSGWLNADAYCRESKEGHMRCGARYILVGGQQAVDDRGARSVQERARLQIGGRARGGAHGEHVAHVRDAGGVEAQRLVERRALPRVERRAHAVRGAVYGSGAAGVGRPRRHAACRGGPDCILGAGHGEERTENM